MQGFKVSQTFGARILKQKILQMMRLVFGEMFLKTHRLAIGKSTKPKSDNQIMKWLKNPHSDSAEYKMWGNGVALPNVVFVLSGIVWATQLEE